MKNWSLNRPSSPNELSKNIYLYDIDYLYTRVEYPIPIEISSLEKYRIEWISDSGYRGHGDWVPYELAKSYIDYYKIHCPTIKHMVVKYKQNEDQKN
jgi:hypothetical protein